ncbi:MAG: choice-of-anchor J domain-containing protein [Saprospiraceae bacterium]|nr:choice-of-anchor J domain-containing protein [Saprospiraceae bacterium]
MISIIKKFTFLVLISVSIFALDGCIKGEFDAPPSGGVDPNISADQIVSLTEVMTKYVAGKFTLLGLDKYMKAVVVADDRSGNFYKTLILEDENSDLGIAILIDMNEIHSLYPVGSRVFVKLKDLTISDYNGAPQLGLGVDNTGTSPSLGRIPTALVPDILIIGKSGLPVVPRVKKITELGPNDINTLIKLESVQFKTVGTTYADNNPASPQTKNRDLVDCANNLILVRNSGFADFAGEPLPEKNGSLTAVYSVFKSDKQLFIRTLADVVFDKDRCGGGGTTGSRISIKSVRDAFANGATVAPDGFVQGVVISDASNLPSQNMVVQDGEYGITLRFSSTISVPVNTEVKVNVGGIKLEEFKTLLQVNGIDNTSVTVVGPTSIVPKELTVAQLDINKYESTLVKIKNAELSGGTKYSDKIVVTDATGQVQLYTATAATFSSQPIKNGVVDVTAILSEFTTGNQLLIRSLNDISGGSPCDPTVATSDCDGDGVLNGQDCAPSNVAIFPGAPCDDGNAATVNDVYNATCQCAGSAPGNGFEESFTSQMNNVDIAIAGWENVAVKGTRKWQGKLFSGNTYAQSTAFNDTNAEMEDWLITPEVITNNSPTLTFESAKAFWVHEGLSVWVTTNYTGNPATTSWVKIPAKVALNSDPDNTFIPSGNIDLKTYGSSVRIGFKYEGNKATNTSTYRLDNIKVK